MKFETYTLVLNHDYEIDGEICKIDEPLIIKYCADRTMTGTGILLNRMFEEMKHEALKRAERREP